MATEQLYILEGGFVDGHVHIRDLREAEKQTFEKATEAAAAGGVTTICAMPNTKPPIDTPQMYTAYKSLAHGRILVDTKLIFKATPESAQYFGQLDTDLLKYYMVPTTNNNEFASEQDARDVMTKVQDGMLLVAHMEGDQIDIGYKVAAECGIRIHAAHVDSAKHVDRLEKAVAERPGMVTAEVTPHHFWLTESDAANLGGDGRMKPPLGTEKDRDALRWAVKNRLITVFATDDAPHTRSSKTNFNPKDGPYGVSGLVETSFKMALQAVEEGYIDSLDHLFELMQKNPAKVFGIDLNPRNWIVIDLNAPFEIKNEELFTMAGASPFNRRTGKGLVKETWVDNERIYADGKMIDIPPRGKVLSHSRQ